MNQHSTEVVNNAIDAAYVVASAGLQLVRVDKIASATRNLGLSHELEVVPGVPARAPRAGDVVVVRTLTDNVAYNTLELVTGRMARLIPGDIIAGVLGARRALKGFVGDVPEALEAGDRLHLLNMGGVIGRQLGSFHNLSSAVEVEVIGLAVRRSSVTRWGRILNIAEGRIQPRDSLDNKIKVPLVLIAGTCMNSGKTYAATEIIKHLTRAGLRVAAAKLSGVACLRDTLGFEDHGAVRALSFLDCGLPSTVGLPTLVPIAKGIIAEASKAGPDLMVIELGDGILGGYGVASIFGDRELMSRVVALVFCANDFVGAWGGREILARAGVSIDVVSGPVTDSQMGIDYLREELGLAAANALTQGQRLAQIVKERVEKWSR
jgi:hypothetical protein